MPASAKAGALLGYGSGASSAGDVRFADAEGRRLVYAAGNAVVLADAETGEQVHAWSCAPAAVGSAPAGGLTVFAVNPETNRLATVHTGPAPELNVLQMPSMRAVVTTSAPGGDLGETTALAFSADGTRLAALTAEPEYACTVLDASDASHLVTAELTKAVAGAARGVLRFHPTRNDLVAVAGARTCRIIRFPHGLQKHPAWFADVDVPDNAKVGADTTAVCWDGDTLYLGNSLGSVYMLPRAASTPRPGGCIVEGVLVAAASPTSDDGSGDAASAEQPVLGKCVLIEALEDDVVLTVHPEELRYWRLAPPAHIGLYTEPGQTGDDTEGGAFLGSHALVAAVKLPRTAAGIGCAALAGNKRRLAVGARGGVLQVLDALAAAESDPSSAPSASPTSGDASGALDDDALDALAPRVSEPSLELFGNPLAFAFERVENPIGAAPITLPGEGLGFVVASADGALAYYTVGDGSAAVRLHLRRGGEPIGAPRTTRVASSGRYVALAREDGTVVILDATVDPMGASPLFRGRLEGGAEAAENASKRDVHTLAFAPGPADAQHTCLACVSADGNVYMLSVGPLHAACAGSIPFPTPPAAGPKRINMADKNVPRVALPRLKCGTWIGQRAFAVILGLGDLMQFDVPQTCLATVPDESTFAPFDEAALRRRSRRLASPLTQVATSRDGSATLAGVNLQGELLLYAANSFSKCEMCAPSGLGPARKADEQLKPTKAHGSSSNMARTHADACAHAHHLGAPIVAVGGRADTLVAYGNVNGTIAVCRAPDMLVECEVQAHLRSASYSVAREYSPNPPPVVGVGVAGLCFVHPELLASVGSDGMVYLLPVGTGATAPPCIPLAPIDDVAPPMAYGEPRSSSQAVEEDVNVEELKQKHASALAVIRGRIAEVKAAAERASERNDASDPRERLNFIDLVVNRALYDEIASKGKEEVDAYCDKVHRADAAAKLLHERIKRQCWDSCKDVPGYKLSPLFDDTPNAAPPVWSFPMLKRQKNARRLAAYSLLRQVDCLEVAARSPVHLGFALTIAHERAPAADTRDTMAGDADPAVVDGASKGSAAAANGPAAGSAKQPAPTPPTQPREDDETPMMSRAASMADQEEPVPLELIDDVFGDAPAILALQTARANAAAVEESGETPLYHEYELYVPYRIATQVALLMDKAHNERVKFNRMIDKARSNARAEACERLTEIAAKATIAVEELHIIGGEQVDSIDQTIPRLPVARLDETPEKDVLTVTFDEIAVKRVLNAAQQKVEDARLAAEEEARRRAEGTEEGRRGVKDMMAGTLVKKKEGFVDIKRELWMDEDRMTWTDAQKRAFKEYEKAVKAQEEEKEKVRRQLEGELRMYREEAQEAVHKFDVVELKALRIARAECEEKAAQYEFAAARLSSASTERTEQVSERFRLEAALTERQTTLYQIGPTKDVLRKRRDAAAKAFEEVIEAEQAYERGAKKELISQGADESTAAILLRNFKKKPGAADLAAAGLNSAIAGSGAQAARGKGRGPRGTLVQSPEKEVLLNPPTPDEEAWQRGPPPAKPAECENAVYEIFVQMWSKKASLEARVREMYAIWVEAEGEFSRAKASLDTVTQEVKSLIEESGGIEADLQRRRFDLDVSLPIKQGIDEVEQSTVATDYGPALFIDRDVCEGLNRVVVANGEEKVETMRQLIAAKNSIYTVAWESRRLDMLEGNLKELLRDYQMLRLTKDMHKVFSGDLSRGPQSEEDSVTMQINFSADSHTKRVSRMRRTEKKHGVSCESMGRDTIGLLDRMTVVSKLVEMRRQVVEATISSGGTDAAMSSSLRGPATPGSLPPLDETRPSTAAHSAASVPIGHGGGMGAPHAFSDLTAGLPDLSAPPRAVPDSAPSGIVSGELNADDKEMKRLAALRRRHREVSATRKLREIARAQEMELVLLQAELERLQKRSFPSFALAPRHEPVLQ